MEYLIIILLLFVFLLAYFKIADKYNIIDKPNHRSAHSEITLRGGGIIFPIVFLLFLGSQIFHHNAVTAPTNYIIFGAGLFAICVISFIDDVVALSNKIRIFFHFISVTLLLWFIDAFRIIPIWALPLLFILIIGILNAYNFMDGINGITGLYSLITLCSLWYINQNIVNLVEGNFIIFPILACIVFLFFNFRKKAKCFMGDIGSIGIGFWIVSLLGLLIFDTGEIKYLLFLTVYGIDVILTILERLKLKENIFDAHRRHLYQLLVNEKQQSHLLISFVYAFIQILINAVIVLTDFSFAQYFLILVTPLIILYIAFKIHIQKTINQNKISSR